MSHSLVNLIRQALQSGFTVELITVGHNGVELEFRAYDKGIEREFVDFNIKHFTKILDSISAIRGSHPFPRVFIDAANITLKTSKKGKAIPIR